MEPSRNVPMAQERGQLRMKVVDDAKGILNYFWPFHPVQLFIDILWAALRLFRPLAPHLVPLAVFSVTLPLIILLSIASGYVVWKSVAVGWESELFLQYGDGRSPYAEVALPNIVAQQPYDIWLHLVVPASESNLALGNFMATLTLASTSNNTLAVTRKPAIVMPQYVAPWSYLYNRPGTIDLNIQMLSNFVVGTSRALGTIELGRRDQWKTLGEGRGRELAVLSGTLRGVVLHHGLRGLISRFPLLSALAAAGMFFFIMFIGLAACLMPAVEWHFPPEGEERRILEPEDKQRRRRRSRREAEEKERTGSKSRPRTPTGRWTDGSGSRTRQSTIPRDRDVKTEPEEEVDSPVLVPVTPLNTAATGATYGATSPLMRRRVQQTPPPANEYIENA